MIFTEPFLSNENQNVGPGLFVTFVQLTSIMLGIELVYVPVAIWLGLPIWP